MSENIRGDAEALRAFAGRLRQFQSEMQSNQLRLRGQFNEVSRTCRDSVQQQFAQEFQEASRLLEQFLGEITDTHLPYLQKKAHQIDEYKQGR